MLFKRVYCLKKTITPKICIIGGGPAGFYTAQHLLKNITNVEINIFERLPVPFGLVRFGVAPDHPEVKNVINTFTKTAQSPQVKFIGNINLGKTVSLQEIKDAYHVVVLSYGAEQDRILNIPGENLSNIFAARSIVGWYNGLPWNSDLKIDLSGRVAVIIGQGNVAIDVARILLTPVDILKTTDITQHALEVLMTSQIKKVYLVGRRGPLQAAFTIKELREMLKLPNCYTKWNPDDFIRISEVIPKLQRPRRRITELMLNSLNTTEDSTKINKYFIPKFFRAPLKFSGTDKVSAITLGVTELKGGDMLNKSAVLTDKIEELNCDLAVRSIGYKSINIDKNIPFDSGKGVVVNKDGRVDNGLYSSGWVASGPTGVILTTMSNSFEIANNISKDLINKVNVLEDKPGFNKIREIIREKNVPIVTWKGWEKIDNYEQELGRKVGKPREKIIDFKKMLEIGGEYL